MSGYRSRSERARALGGRLTRAVHALISARELVIDTWSEVERVIARGRQTQDQTAEDDSRFEGEGVPMENCQPIGLVARPASNATVEAVVAHVGATGTNPYIISTIDHGRAAILDARGIDTSVRSFTILYNDTDVVEIRDGKIRLGSLNGTTERLPTWQDFQDLRSWLRAQFDNTTGHVHATPAGPTTLITTSPGPALSVTPADAPTPTGTQRVEAE